MQAYDNDVDAGDSDDAGVLEGPDAFGASRAAFDELLATLGSAKAAGWTHDQLEEQLETDGRELLRRLYQDHLDLRALREQHAVATGRIGPSTDARGIAHRKVEPGHLRHLATVFGTVRVTRCAWRAEGARNLYPDRKSTRLNSSHGSISYAVFCLINKKSRGLSFVRCINKTMSMVRLDACVLA